MVIKLPRSGWHFKKDILAVVCVYGPDSSLDYQGFQGTLNCLLEGVSSEVSVFLLRVFNAHKQRESYLMGWDKEELPPSSEPEQHFINGLLY